MTLGARPAVESERPGWERWFRRVLVAGWLLLAVLLAASQIDWSAIGRTEPSAVPAAPPPRSTPAPVQPSRPATPAVELALEFVAASWLEVEVDGELVELGRVVAAGEVLKFEGEELISVRLGNAGGVLLRLDGRDLGPAGADGEVVRREFGPDGELAHQSEGSGDSDSASPMLVVERPD